MQKQAESRITAEAVIQAVEQGAKSPTAIAKTLGYKSGSSAIIKSILKAVPDVRERLALNASQADGQAAQTEPANKAAFDIPDCVPYRKSSGYAMVWAILYAHRDKGINRTDLTEKYKAWSGKPDKNCGFDVHVVLSPRENGSSHRSASKASQYYWVERQNDWCRLHLVGDKK